MRDAPYKDSLSGWFIIFCEDGCGTALGQWLPPANWSDDQINEYVRNGSGLLCSVCAAKREQELLQQIVNDVLSK